MLDQFDGLFNGMALTFLFALLAIGLGVFVWLGSLPGTIAAGRGHAQAQAVAVCGWLGLLFLPLWPLALVWAFVSRPGVAVSPESRSVPAPKAGLS
jgi:hypothetical protein